MLVHYVSNEDISNQLVLSLVSLLIEPFFKFSVLLLVLFCLSYRLKSDMHRHFSCHAEQFL